MNKDLIEQLRKDGAALLLTDKLYRRYFSGIDMAEGFLLVSDKTYYFADARYFFALKEKLSLSNYPKRMECYDISNISGVDKVGSMVVFINGEPAKEEYRRFKIKTVELIYLLRPRYIINKLLKKIRK